MSGKPVVLFEGIDGAGKTYALTHLKEHYEKLGERVHVVDSIPFHVFLESHDKEWFDLSNKNTRYVEYLAWQVNNYYKNILPELGKSVILIDRYVPSCFAYNIIDPDRYGNFLLGMMDSTLRNFFIPDVTFIFDVPDDVLKVRHNVTDQPEQMKKMDFVNFVRQEYQRFSKIYSERWNVSFVDGSQPIESIIHKMLTTIDIALGVIK